MTLFSSKVTFGNTRGFTTATPEFWGNPIPPVTVSCPWKPFNVLQAVAGVSQYSGKIQLPDFKAVGSGFISSFKNRRSQTDVRKGEPCNLRGITHLRHPTLGGCPRLAFPWSSQDVFYEGVCMHGYERGWLSAAKCFSFCEKTDVALETMFKNSRARWGKVIFCCTVRMFVNTQISYSASPSVLFCSRSPTVDSQARLSQSLECDPLCLSLSEAWHSILT